MTIEIGKGEVPLVLENNNSWSGTYLSPTNTTGSGCPSQLNCTLYRNDTNVTNPDINDTFGIGSYNYTYNTSGNENYSSNSTSNILVINKIPTSISMWLNDTNASKSYNLNDIINFTAMINVTDQNLTINLTSNFTDWNDTYNDTVFYNTTNLTEEGLFYITASFDGNENYSSTSTTRYFDTIAPQYQIISPAASVTYTPDEVYWFNISLLAATIDDILFGFKNSTSNFTNYTYPNVLNNSGLYYISMTDLPADNYTFFWIANRSATENITNYTDNVTFNVTKNQSYAIMYVDPGWTVLSGISTTVYCNKTIGSPSSTVQLYRDGSLRSSGANSTYETATLAEGSYSYVCYVTESLSSNYTNYSVPVTLTVQSSGTFVPGGGTDDTGDTTPAGQFTLTSSESDLVMDAGTSRVISFTISNTLSSGDVTDVTATVTGISSEWYALDKTTVDRVRKNDNEKIRMTLNVPANASDNNYQITFKIAGKSFSGSTLSRETTVQLEINSVNQSDIIEEAAVINADQNSTGNDTFSNATGFLNIKSEYVPYVVIALGAALSIIIFFNRGFITENLMKMGGISPAKEAKKPKSGIKLPSLKKFNYKLSINLKKQLIGNEPKTLDLKEEKADDLEREIKKDMKELKNIMEAEKKIKKNRK